MCGRFTLSTDVIQLQKLFDIQQTRADLAPSYNVAPTHNVAVVVQRQGSNSLELMRWGLIPVWAKDTKMASKMINARAETITEKPSFKRLLKSQRCLVLADGFYEWREDAGKKAPMFIRLKSLEAFGFAGLYDTWKSPEGESITTCTIITTAANELMRKFHHRMPIILPKSAHPLWLDPARQDIDELVSLLQPYPANEMEAYPVSPLVNSPSHNVPECVLPVA
ncbi:MAG: SOS response-associated peptidase [Chloroflexi bacterium]|nr:SOS response-associated peptidase [Chloroflexota bacterium]